jgi:hypothetical protein
MNNVGSLLAAFTVIFRALQTIRVDLQRQLRGLLPRARQAFVSMWAPIPLNDVLACGVVAAPAAAVTAAAVGGVADAVCGAVTEIPSTCSIDSNRLLNKLCVVAGPCVELLAAPSLTAWPPLLWPWGIKLSVGEAAVAAAVEIKDMMFPH